MKSYPCVGWGLWWLVFVEFEDRSKPVNDPSCPPETYKTIFIVPKTLLVSQSGVQHRQTVIHVVYRYMGFPHMVNL